MPHLLETALDASVVAPSIYGNSPHIVTTTALCIEQEIKAELEFFICEFVQFLGLENSRKYFRLDLYFTRHRVYIIEVNVEVADGWGVSLNLQRAAGKSVVKKEDFPDSFPTYPGDHRRTEFQLAVDEFALLGHTAGIQEHPGRLKDPFDNKLHLARFSEKWKGDRVLIPRFYWSENSVWEDVPQKVYLKFAEKFCPEAVKARYSAKPRLALGRAKQMKKLFAQTRAVAQEMISPFCTNDGGQMQAVAMCTSLHVVTGYIQVAPEDRMIINDRGTKKGALFFL